MMTNSTRLRPTSICPSLFTLIFTLILMTSTLTYSQIARSEELPDPALQGDEAGLLAVSSDVDLNERYLLRGIQDTENHLIALRFYILNLKKNKTEIRDFSFKDLKDEIPLLEGPLGIDIVTLQGPHLDAKGGELTLKMLRKGGLFSREYRNFHMELQIVDGNSWRMNANENNGRLPFDSLKLLGRFEEGHAKGIEALSLLLKGQEVAKFRTEDLAHN